MGNWDSRTRGFAVMYKGLQVPDACFVGFSGFLLFCIFVYLLGHLEISFCSSCLTPFWHTMAFLWVGEPYHFNFPRLAFQFFC